jgi:dihydropteroate synthase
MMPSFDLGAWTRERPRVMGILNVTPDSFSDGGRFFAPDAALAQAQSMLADGVDMLDVGAESTRPGAIPVSVAEELDRLGPVLEALRTLSVPVSVDSSKPEVMCEAVRLGVVLVNDVRALRVPGAMDFVASHSVAMCLMHMPGEPDAMQQMAHYTDVVVEVETFLLERARLCVAMGLPATSIVLDPGFGFGKTLAHNRLLFQALPRLVAHGFPVLVGVSRKRMIGELAGVSDPSERDAGSLAAQVMALDRGARILRVHAVKPAVQALNVWLGLV